MSRKKVLNPDELQTTDRETVLFYKGRHPLDANTHVYIVKDSGREVTFKKKLQRRHSVGYGYPVAISQGGHIYSTKRFDRSTEYWDNAKDVALWVRDTVQAETELKRLREKDELAKLARQTVEPLHSAYQRASQFTRLAVIAAIVETLEEK